MQTAECVSPKHPDKMCDQISDGILDFCLAADPDSRVAVEAMGGHGKVVVMGEVTTKADLTDEKIKEIVHSVTGGKEQVEVNLAMQSGEISRGVDDGGAGDQGIMRGYAVIETPTFMPLEYELARDLCQFIYEAYPYDGKTQVTIDHFMAVKIVASFQNVSKSELKARVFKWVEERKIMAAAGCDILVNPAGDWNQGGFDADTGLTGRKLMVDNYGPRFAIGGGAFSGKDASKVDRSAAYMARLIAVDALVRNRDLVQTEVELAYAIGVAEPLSYTVIGTDKEGKRAEVENVPKVDLTPKGIIERLKLKEPKYRKTAEWGHFGRDFDWN